MRDVIIVDDEKDIRNLLSGILEDEGYTIRSAADSDSFFNLLKGRLPSLILLDIWLKKSKMDGMEILLTLRKYYPDIPVIMISGHGTVETAVRAMQAGAVNFLEKPIKVEHLLLLVGRTLEEQRIKQEHHLLKAQMGTMPTLFTGNSSVMIHLRHLIEKHAPTNSRIILTGEVGTGKKTLAHMIHQNSLRADYPFIVMNPKNKSLDTIERELFGFNNNQNPEIPSSAGALEKAHNGTLYLDGIEYLPKSTQSKLTKFLVEKQYARIMSPEKTVESDIRVIAGISLIPELAVEENILSSDFFQRLNVVRLQMPALRERREDIAPLIHDITAEIAKIHETKLPHYTEEALIAMQIYDWPGNIRQLRNVVENIVIMSHERENLPITISDLPYELRDTVPPMLAGTDYGNYMNIPLREAREIFEREYLLAQLTRFKSNISKTAQFIGMERSALHRKLRGLGIAGRYTDSDSLEEVV